MEQSCSLYHPEIAHSWDLLKLKILFTKKQNCRSPKKTKNEFIYFWRSSRQGRNVNKSGFHLAHRELKYTDFECAWRTETWRSDVRGRCHRRVISVNPLAGWPAWSWKKSRNHGPCLLQKSLKNKNSSTFIYIW